MDLGLGPKGKISGMCHYGGAVVACSTDKSIKVRDEVVSYLGVGYRGSCPPPILLDYHSGLLSATAE